VWIAAIEKRQMQDCPFHSQLSAFHDGEMDSDAAGRFAGHLAGCAQCMEELTSLQSISGLFASLPEGRMYPLELARLHQNLDNTVSSQTSTADFLRTAGMLSALAASILVISSVWIAEIPSRPAATLSPGVAVVPASESVLPAQMPAWERTALTLRVEPLSYDQGSLGPGGGDAIPQVGLADARSFGDNSTDAQVADWMVAGLGSPSAATGNR
jgi:anti-sigma factor RsiW